MGIINDFYVREQAWTIKHHVKFKTSMITNNKHNHHHHDVEITRWRWRGAATCEPKWYFKRPTRHCHAGIHDYWHSWYVGQYISTGSFELMIHEWIIEDEEFLLLASDGLFDVFQDQDAITFIRSVTQDIVSFCIVSLRTCCRYDKQSQVIRYWFDISDVCFIVYHGLEMNSINQEMSSVALRYVQLRESIAMHVSMMATPWLRWIQWSRK
jgi:hypothetical protein